MAKKWGIGSLILFGLYSLVMYVYIFHFSDGGVPESFKGTVADPETFMTDRELLLSEEYSKIRNFIFFIVNPFEWLMYFYILIFGISHLFEKWSKISNWKVVHYTVYLFLLTLLTFIVFFPINYYRYTLSKGFGISTQGFASWMSDNVIDFWLNFLITVITVSVLYWLIRKSKKKWWLFAWILTVPFSIFLMYIQPVIIDPLYNEFYPLQNKELEEKILALADKANIPAEHVFEVNMADKTNALNAYVTGVGNNSRIVLWDTTLNRLNEEEILFIMAHEMGHYVEKHIYIGIAGYLLMMFVGLWLISKIAPWMIKKYGHYFKVKSLDNISSLPIILLISSVLLFFSNPIYNSISRYQEARVDQYAIELVNDSEAAVSGFQKLAKAGLSEMNPPLLIKWFRYTHPPMLERINKIVTKE
ncbi:peptidase M48 [Ureibacillus massiliensis 4400831 = CIP 108448 = CCUG 49529]|uniref:Peptidase M48 n=1 Tax=Ureibacillus massiliensis 4400831 = CIP 108448 = CCUG 49529 TaxID=1211035 RepID=A0A0A3JWZ8_9BACL|nr:M48 family metallopeptidase [Ureibacillus massiliensis]KGR91532.1 peptidase M48 [Ureibacillus massiliensis 4400831 = CIP 108448 = CCUG 49529]